MQVHEAGGLQRRQAGTAFADLLSAMEALPEAFLAGKSSIFITELRLLHLWVHFDPAQSCLVVKVTRTCTCPVSAALKLSNDIFFRIQVHVFE